jgi:hypothetical protein
MSRIPEFTRTVLPDRSVGIARAQVARAPYDLKAEAMNDLQQGVVRTTNMASDYIYREAAAKNATAVNQGAIEFKKRSADLESEMRQKRAANPENFHKDFDSELQKVADEFIKSAPTEAAKTALRGTLDTQRASIYEQNLTWEKTRKAENYVASIDKSTQNLSLMSDQRGRAGANIDDLLRDADATAIAGSTIVEGPEKVEKIRQTVRRRVIESAIDGAIETNPAYALELIEKYGTHAGGEEAAINTVMKNEGGFVEVDGSSGAPAIYGINRKWHQEAYDEAKRITDEKGAEAGQAYARSFYKTEYWEKNKIGELPVEAQTVVMDGVVNHSAAFSKKLVEAAKEGKTEEELLAMREEEYRRLAKANPAKYAQSLPGWLNRLEGLRAEGSVPPEKLTAMRKEAQTSLLKLDDTKKTNQLVDSARSQWDLYNKFAEGDLTLSAVSNLEEQGKIDKNFAAFMRQNIIKNNPISAEDQNQIYSDLFDEVSQLGIKTKDGKLKLEKDDANLEDLVRLQNKIIKESVRGVTGLKPLLNKVSPAVLSFADKERGTDDKGADSFLGFFRSTETYDSGYETIQNFLEKQGKEKDVALKASMLSDFVEQADALPEDVLADKRALDGQLTSIANNVIAKSMRGGAMKNIPVPAIKYLLDNPSTSAQFDQLFGAGAANKVLGR